MIAPKAKKQKQITKIHGKTLEDNYCWMRERGQAEVMAYLKAENTYTDEMMRSTKALQQSLYEEMVSHIKETDMSVPVRRGEYYYYSRTQAGSQYPIYCRKHQSLDAAEETILDVNALAKGQDYFSIGVLSISPDHRYLAYSSDTTGEESYVLEVLDLEKNILLPTKINNTGSSCEWAEDSQTLFYVVLDQTKRPYQLMRYVLDSTDGSKLVYEEKDERFFLNVEKTKDNQYLLLELESKACCEVYFLKSTDADGTFKIIQRREANHEYAVEHQKGQFVIMTNRDAINFKVMKTDVDKPSEKHWVAWIEHEPLIKIEGVDIFKDWIVVYRRNQGLCEVQVYPEKKGARPHTISFDENVYTVTDGANPEYDSNHVRVHYTSMVTPLCVIDYDFQEQKKEIKKQTEVPHYDPQLYETKRIFAKAKDGVKIPISLVYQKGMDPNEKKPLLLYGYGSYGISIDPTFSSTRLSLLERGFIFAIAHIRGGGDLGRPWYDEGKKMNKWNTFDDFITCAEFLIQENYTSKNKLVISGGSAGGLLMGVVVNKRPELFRAALMHVPFVDVLNTMLDASLPLTVTEYDEWGDPNNRDVFDYMSSYSPYDNIIKQDYPAMLVTGGLNDPRVQYWEPTKWVAKLRETKSDTNDLLLKMHMGAGHAGASGRYDYLKEISFDYAFLLKIIGRD